MKVTGLSDVEFCRLDMTHPILIAIAEFSDGYKCRVRYQPFAMGGGGQVTLCRRGDPKAKYSFDRDWVPNPRPSPAREAAVHASAPAEYARLLIYATAGRLAKVAGQLAVLGQKEDDRRMRAAARPLFDALSRFVDPHGHAFCTTPEIRAQGAAALRLALNGE